MHCRYIGVLGPRARTQRMLTEIGLGLLGDSRIHSPIGLDIGANTPQEVALAIVAEVQSVLVNATGDHLRTRVTRVSEQPLSLMLGFRRGPRRCDARRTGHGHGAAHHRADGAARHGGRVKMKAQRKAVRDRAKRDAARYRTRPATDADAPDSDELESDDELTRSLEGYDE